MNSYQNLYRMKILNEASICKDSFYEFVKRAWDVIETDDFISGEYIKIICGYLQAVFDGTLTKRNLIINQPPRTLKTMLSGVFWPAWVWANDPKKRFIFASYAQTLSVDASIKCRKLIESDWYKERFPDVQLEKKQEDYRATTEGGHRISIGVDGAGTGRGADYFLCDDLLKAEDAYSDTIREKTNRWFSETVSTRRNSLKKGYRIIVCQRLHENDVVGYVLEREGPKKWEHVILPMEYDGKRYVSSIGLDDWRTEVGESLHPERFGAEEIEDLKVSLGSYAVPGQLQQRPVATEGAIFKKEWFERRIDLPRDKVAYRFLSFDTAGTANKTSAYSACTVGELTPDYHLFIREVERRKLEFPQLLEWITELSNKYADKLDAIFIENKSSGQQAVQSLQQSAPDWIRELIFSVNIPSGEGKEQRAYSASVFCDNGCILLPPQNHPDYQWLLPFEEELFKFPASRYKDQTDSFTQIINQLSDSLAEGMQFRKSGGMNALY